MKLKEISLLYIVGYRCLCCCQESLRAERLFTGGFAIRELTHQVFDREPKDEALEVFVYMIIISSGVLAYCACCDHVLDGRIHPSSASSALQNSCSLGPRDASVLKTINILYTLQV